MFSTPMTLMRVLTRVCDSCVASRWTYPLTKCQDKMAIVLHLLHHPYIDRFREFARILYLPGPGPWFHHNLMLVHSHKFIHPLWRIYWGPSRRRRTLGTFLWMDRVRKLLGYQLYRPHVDDWRRCNLWPRSIGSQAFLQITRAVATLLSPVKNPPHRVLGKDNGACLSVPVQNSCWT